MSFEFALERIRIGVIGLGYVGLPLAVKFGKRYPTIGFDINQKRIAELRAGRDGSLELESEELAATPHLTYTASEDDLRRCNLYVVTVPTPVNQDKEPGHSSAQVRESPARRGAQARRHPGL